MMTAAADISAADVWGYLGDVLDPEIPVLSVVDLGIVRGVTREEDGFTVTITPTYSGCPATDVIQSLIEEKLAAEGVAAKIKTVLTPPWTTDWLSDEGRRKLKDFGIAPPAPGITSKRALLGEAQHVSCPRCNSGNTRKISEFGSTPCKAHYQCSDCLEPFDYFKCI